MNKSVPFHYYHNYRICPESLRVHRVLFITSPMGPVGKMAPGDHGVVEGQCWGNPTRLAAMAGRVAAVREGHALAAGVSP